MQQVTDYIWQYDFGSEWYKRLQTLNEENVPRLVGGFQ